MNVNCSSPVISSLVPAAIPNLDFHLSFIRGKGQNKEHLIDYEFTTYDIFCLGCCTVVGVWYLFKKVCLSYLEYSRII